MPPNYPVYPVTDLRDLMLEVSRRYADRVALKSKKEGVYQSLTYHQLRGQVIRLACAYSELGLQKGDRVALLAENRTEWAVAYLAAVCSGYAVVPVDKDLTHGEIVHLLRLAEPRVLVCSGDHVGRLGECRSDLPFVERIISMEQEGGRADLTFAEALHRGREAESSGSFYEAPIRAEDLAAIIFTSGTTGNSKGVMLTHGNLISNIMATAQYVSIEEGVLLSVLPLHHMYECMGGFLLALYQGCTICHSESLRRIPENLRETGPTVVLGVPLLFETLYRRIQQGIREKGEGRFRVAMGIAALSERVLGMNVRRLLFKSVRQKLGGRLELLISGGAAIQGDVVRGFRELGIDFIQGYGMTEASPIISVNRVGCSKDEAVGLPLPGVEVRVVEGEILVRSPSVMKGYYRNPEATQEALRDGWLHTGDLGYLDEDGFLHINGRSKSVIVTPNGKNVYPEEVEGVLGASPYISEVLVWGGAESDPSEVEVQAVVVPNTETFDQKFGPDAYDEAKVQDVIGDEIREHCKRLAPYKRVKRFTLRAEVFEKTTTRKIKRHLYTGRLQQ